MGRPDIIDEVYAWQVNAGNAEKPYDDLLEASFQIEEALEGMPFVGDLAEVLSVPSDLPKLENHVSRAIVGYALDGTGDFVTSGVVSDLERFDKALDAIVFAIGSIAKLKLSADDLKEGLRIVNNANVQKLGCPRDQEGKLLKPEGFIEPQPELQKILDRRFGNNPEEYS